MVLKENLIKELEGYIRSSESHNTDYIEYLGLSSLQARDLLEKIRNNEYDDILSSVSKARLERLSKYYLTQQASLKSPSLKEYRKVALMEEKNFNVKYFSICETDEEERQMTEKRYNSFLDSMNAGVYDDLLDTPSFWFGNEIDINTLSFWDELRKTHDNCNEITFPNYIVASIYFRIMSHADNIRREKERTGKDTYISLTGQRQSPATSEEQEELKAFENVILSTNYDWREARNIVSDFWDLDIYNNSEFPHNVDDIKRCFNKRKDTAYDKYESGLSCYHDVDAIVERAKKLADDLTPENLCKLFLNRNEDEVDAYLRRMIVSQFDGKFLENIDYSGDRIKRILNNPQDFSEDELNSLLSSVMWSSRTLKPLYDLAIGTLYSLYAFRGTKVNLLDDCKNFQKKLNCYRGIVNEMNFNSVMLPNGERIYSISSYDIDNSFAAFQRQYEYYCKNSSSDLEFVEGSAEVLGNVLISQIFMQGNKRTARCLFNAMMISNGIVPPVIDFTENNQKLWFDLACNRDKRYLPAKKTIIDESLKTKEYFLVNPEKNL